MMESGASISHYDEALTAPAGDGSAPLQGMTLFAHERRMALLEGIAIGDVAGATVVDFGVGAWGFGCVFPKLKSCAQAIGLDIAEHALDHSRKITSGEGFLNPPRYEYSNGYAIALPDAGVDLFFCGETIQSIADTRAFLTEAHRVMKPGALAIFTAPNASPWLYRQLDLRWAVGLEHAALPGFDELRDSLEMIFEPVEYLGFNQSLLPGVDEHFPPALQSAWVDAGLDHPRDATGVIAVVRKRADAAPRPAQSVATFGWRDVPVTGSVTQLTLSGAIDGGALDEGSEYRLTVPPGMDRCHLIFWSHDWSGIAEVGDGVKSQLVNLYSHVGGCLRHTVTALDGDELIIRRSGQKDQRSMNDELILFSVVFAGDRAGDDPPAAVWGVTP